MIQGLGYVQDIPDHRDDILGVGGGGWPWSFSVEHLLPPVLSQGVFNSCVAHGVAELVYASHVSSGILTPELCSRLFIWNKTRALNGTLRYNMGVSIRDAIKILNSCGFCPESAFPYESFMSGDNGKLPAFMCHAPPVADAKAYDQRIAFHNAGKNPARYYRIDATNGSVLRAIKGAICAGLPVMFGADVSQEFVDGTFDHSKPVLPPRETIGGHCMVFTGYEGDIFRVRNSWGPHWGDRGSCLFSSDYVIQTLDRWTIEHAPIYSG